MRPFVVPNPIQVAWAHAHREGHVIEAADPEQAATCRDCGLKWVGLNEAALRLTPREERVKQALLERFGGRFNAPRRVRVGLAGLRQLAHGRPWWPRCASCPRRIWPWQVGQTEGTAWEHYICAVKRLLRGWWAEKLDASLFAEVRRSP